MKLLYVKFQGIDLFQDGLEIDFIARQRVTENNDDSLSILIDGVYKQDVVGIIGINASGKTLTLRWLSFLLDVYLREGKVDNKDYKTLLHNQTITMEAYFASEKHLYKIESIIKPNEDGNHVFYEEKLWTKKRIKSLSRKRILEFNNSQLEIVRSKENSLFLSDHMSIMISQIKKQSTLPRIVDQLKDTNFNLMRVLGKVPIEIIGFLDNSIEYIYNDDDPKEKMKIRLKFINQKKEIIVYNPLELATYLSSGTIKGLNVFAGIQNVLSTGGFLIVDEIENHFNEAIVKMIIQMFKHKEINVKGATLVFTTHYAGLLDEFNRNDSIYISFKEETLRLKNLNNILKRNDYSKSEVYQSSFVGKTAPSYESYMKLKRFFLAQGKEIKSNWNQEV